MKLFEKIKNKFFDFIEASDPIRVIEKFFALKVIEDGVSGSEADIKAHKDYAVQIAPAYDYYLWQRCPYRNCFHSENECKIWNCPVGKESHLICKGLITKEKK